MPYYCYRRPGEEKTYFGPVEATNPQELIGKLSEIWSMDGATYWEIKERKDYLQEPKHGSGTKIFKWTTKDGHQLERTYSYPCNSDCAHHEGYCDAERLEKAGG